ncbi:hypothetical protein [Mesorhizobium sp.]|uniref:hypothetical protein n=1 Tax=Mesorhizobium sp. TaxID=1871066 RepID=UPI0025EE217B|nr:hypothetical protein [Mesorhizobium sp.]
MSNFVLVENGIVVQSDRSGTAPEGFIEADESVCPGFLFDGEVFTLPPIVPAIPDRVSARQFKLQLLSAGLLAEVEAWIASQGAAVQIAYDNSGSFVRTDTTMQAGFTALGFTGAQVDAFFTAAAAL